MALTRAQYAAVLARQRRAAAGRLAMPAPDPRVPVRIANPEPAAYRNTGAGFDMPTPGSIRPPAWTRPGQPPGRRPEGSSGAPARAPGSPGNGRGAGGRPEGQSGQPAPSPGAPRRQNRPAAPRRQPVSQPNPAADAVARSTPPASSPPRSTSSGAPRASSSPSASAAPAATTPAKPKPGTIRYKAAKSKAEFDSFDKETRNAALRDFTATHAWARGGDQDAVKDAVAYLLSREKGTFGSQRYADGAPGNVKADRPAMRDAANEGFGGQPNPTPAAAANPAAAAVEGGMSPEALAAYRRRFNIPRADWSADGSMEREVVQDRRDDSLERRLDAQAAKRKRAKAKRRTARPRTTTVDFE